jgi:hypothetical protein
MNIPILDYDAPIPTSRKNHEDSAHGLTLARFSALEPDSRLLFKGLSGRDVQNVRVLAGRYAKQLGWRVTVRKLENNQLGVWRIL